MMTMKMTTLLLLSDSDLLVDVVYLKLSGILHKTRRRKTLIELKDYDGKSQGFEESFPHFRNQKSEFRDKIEKRVGNFIQLISFANFIGHKKRETFSTWFQIT
jgi:hypothetical protein